jgi:16S rRNA (guanine966-N2)-methyltransferase
MRIIAGKHRGRAIRVPRTEALRPSSDRLRQAVFNILDHGGDAFAYAGETVIDLFAGSGAYGLEALSRSAAFATFIDLDGAALLGIRRNAAAIGEAATVALLKLDATRLVTPPRIAAIPAALAFLDPPYRSGRAVAALQGLQTHGWLRRGAVAVVEVGATEPLAPPPAYAPIEERSYGAGRVVFLRLS